MIVTRRFLVDQYFANRRGYAGLRAVQRQYDAWLRQTVSAQWTNPADVKASFASASILRNGRAVFNISGNRYRLVAKIGYAAGIVDIRFFGSHPEYDAVDAETV